MYKHMIHNHMIHVSDLTSGFLPANEVNTELFDDSKHQFHIITIALKPTTKNGIAVLNSLHQRLSFNACMVSYIHAVLITKR